MRWCWCHDDAKIKKQAILIWGKTPGHYTGAERTEMSWRARGRAARRDGPRAASVEVAALCRDRGLFFLRDRGNRGFDWVSDHFSQFVSRLARDSLRAKHCIWTVGLWGRPLEQFGMYDLRKMIRSNVPGCPVYSLLGGCSETHVRYFISSGDVFFISNDSSVYGSCFRWFTGLKVVAQNRNTKDDNRFPSDSFRCIA